MPKRDSYRGQWTNDVMVLLNVNQKVAYDLHSLLCNIICHSALEQLLEDPEAKEFDLPVAPLGNIRLQKQEDGSWQVASLSLGNSFESALNETLRCKESRLYRDQYDRAYNNLVYSLKRFAAENLR